MKPAGAEETAAVHAVIHAAFEARPALDPPAAALTESRDELEARLARHGGLLARVDGVPAGALVLDPAGSTMYLRRVGVVPAMQHHHVAAALIDAAVEAAEGYDDLTVVARDELPATIRFWEHHGFREVRRDPPNVELRRPLRTAVHHAPDADAMRGLGRSIAGQLAAGDLIVLTGSLGAGKTTFTQGLGAGLGVRGAVTSPTFVIARVHPSAPGPRWRCRASRSPALAYRGTSLDRAPQATLGACGLTSFANSIVSLIVSGRLAGQAQDERTVDPDAELVAIFGEPLGDIDPHALLDVVQDLLVAALIADQQKPKAVIAQHLSVARGTLALALQDQVTPSLPSSRAIASARGRSSVKVSSSKKNSLTSGKAAFAHFISSMTCPTERVRYRCPPTVCGQGRTCTATCTLARCKRTCRGA